MNKDSIASTTFQRVKNKDLNKNLSSMSDSIFHKLIRATRKPSKSIPKARVPVVDQLGEFEKLPKHLKFAIEELGILDEPDFERRARLMIGHCLQRNYSLNTCRAYMSKLRRVGLLDTSVQPLVAAFSENYSKHHIRSVEMNSFIKFIVYVKNNFTKFYAPIVVALYTGLRTHEILQLSSKNIVELKNKLANISILRKQTFSKRNDKDNFKPELWRPVYTSYFQQFVEELEKLYSDEVLAFEKHSINLRLFQMTPATLTNRVRHAYFMACGVSPPFGFGIHGIRTMLATFLSQNTDNITAVAQFLQHRNSKTSLDYVRRLNDSKLIETFDKIIDYELADHSSI